MNNILKSGNVLLKKFLYPNFSKHRLPRAMKLGAGTQDSQSGTKQSQLMGKSPFCSHRDLARTGLAPQAFLGCSSLGA